MNLRYTVHVTMAWFKNRITCIILIMLTSFTVLLGNRQLGVHLAHDCVNVNSPSTENSPVIMLHGLTSAKETWNGIYQVIAFLTQRRVCIYDARNHGYSGWNDTFNIDVLAEDLGNFMRGMKIKRASLVGHSLGGLTIMRFALKNPDNTESIFIEDISPKNMGSEIIEMSRKRLKILTDSVSAIPPDADEEIAKKAVRDYIFNMTGYPPNFKQSPFLCRDGVWQWRSNMEVLFKAFDDVDSFFGEMEGRYNGRAFFIYGKDSPFKVNEDKEFIRTLFPNAEFFGVDGASHVVHTHNPVYLNTLIKFINRGDSD